MMNNNAKNPDAVRHMMRTMMNGAQWNAIKKDGARAVAGKTEEDKCGRFADYLTGRFIDACRDRAISARFGNWEKLSGNDKIKLAADIVRVLLANIQSDMAAGRVTIYNHAGLADDFDKTVRPDMSKMPKISVREANDGLMSVSSKGVLSINTNWAHYSGRDPLAFLMDLRHEVMHIVDMFIPEITPLAPDVRRRAALFYVDPHDDMGLYSNNPLELNANLHRREYGEQIRSMLTGLQIDRIRAMNPNFVGLGRIRGR